VKDNFPEQLQDHTFRELKKVATVFFTTVIISVGFEKLICVWKAIDSFRSPCFGPEGLGMSPLMMVSLEMLVIEDRFC